MKALRWLRDLFVNLFSSGGLKRDETDATEHPLPQR